MAYAVGCGRKASEEQGADPAPRNGEEKVKGNDETAAPKEKKELEIAREQENAIRALRADVLSRRNDGVRTTVDILTQEEVRARTAGGRQGEEPPIHYPTPVYLRPGENSPKDKGPSDPKTPQVWKRDRAQPTFARVYVGDGNKLELVSLHVSVTVEGPRARTLVDHVFRNPNDRQLEGTFEYPLPSGASPSYFAMFLGQTRQDMPARFRPRDNTPLPADALARLTPAELVKHIDTNDWGRLQQARIVNKQKAAETYEEIVRGKIDPAVLEYAGGSTFRGRVFPIPAKGYNRVLLAYEELLPVVQEKLVYRFPLPGCELTEMQFALQAETAECRQPAFLPADAKQDEHLGQLHFRRTWSKAKPKGEVVFSCTPASPRVQAISGRAGANGPQYVYARLRPDLPAVEKDTPFAHHAVFLLDTSLSEYPARFDLSMKLLRRILEGDPDIKHFNVLAFSVGSTWLEPKGWLPNTAEGREQALARLDGLVLEGATDLSGALEKLLHPGFDVTAGTPLNCFLLSDGNLNWGETDVATLAARFERRCPFSARFHCYRTGLGAENQELYDALTRKGGGIYHCYGEDDVQKVAQAHRQHCFQVEKVRFVGGPTASDVLVAGRRAAVHPGGELIVAARFTGTGATRVVVEGAFLGKKVSQEFPLEVRSNGELAPRGWAEIAVASLLALNEPRFEDLATAYCQQFGIASRIASFLVLENEADYKRLNLEEERGKTVVGDLGEFLVEMWSLLGQEITPRQAWERFLKRVEPRVQVFAGPNGPHVRKLLELCQDRDFEPPQAEANGALLKQTDAGAEYLRERARDLDKRAEGQRDLSPYLTEARRRAEKGDAAGAVRALSSIVEEHGGRSDALRLVGYRLLDLKQPAQASRLFGQVQKERPFEPHSYRDLARSLEESGRYALAALQYEIVLAGTWHNRFGTDLKTVAQEEYARMMQDAIRKKAVEKALLNHFGERLEQMKVPQPQSDLRVTITWNTDATDVDLWVIEPDGTKCFYQHNRTKNGGELSQDQTQGYGPERYQIVKAPAGIYRVIVHYYRPNPNLLGGETHVQVMIAQHAGTPQEVVERHTVILKSHNQEVEVCQVKWPGAGQ
jgi:hypothetical protein